MEKKQQIIQIPRRFVIEEWGGSETFITEVSTRLNNLGYSAKILTTQALCKTSRETFRGIEIERYPYFYPYLGLSGKAKNLLDKKAGNLFSFSLLRALKKEKTIDIIHLHTGKRLGGIGRYIARKKRIQYVISLHGGQLAVPKDEQDTWTEPTKNHPEWGKFLGLWVGSRRVLDDAAAIICVGNDEYAAISKRYPDKMVEYLPNGVDIERFSYNKDGDAPLRAQKFREKHSIPANRFLCLTTARIDVQKNQLGLVTQLEQLMRDIPDVHLLFVGAVTNDDYLKKITTRLEQTSLTDHCTIIPGIPYNDPDLISAYHAADCFILPSLHEPFGMVVLEAWAAGLPTAASNRGGLTSIITHEENGLLFDPEADYGEPESIGAAVKRFYSEKEFREKLAENGKNTAQSSYSWDVITDKLIAIYRRVRANSIH
jgi:glycosyltransferase involved in cell wall biosynthesis